MLKNKLWLLSGMTAGMAALMAVWWIAAGEAPGGTRLRADTEQEIRHADTVGRQDIEQLEELLTALNDRVQMLADSIDYLESKLVRAHVLTDSIITAERHASSTDLEHAVADGTARGIDGLPPPAAGQTAADSDLAGTHRPTAARNTAAPRKSIENAAAEASSAGLRLRHPDSTLPGASATLAQNADTGQKAAQLNGELAVASAASTTAQLKTQTPASSTPSAIGPKQEGWVVNLSSSPNQADAERFAAKAKAMGIETRQQQVTIKGKQYWRVQTVSFPTAAEAKGYAGTVREKLGLQHVWITRR